MNQILIRLLEVKYEDNIDYYNLSMSKNLKAEGIEHINE